MFKYLLNFGTYSTSIISVLSMLLIISCDNKNLNNQPYETALAWCECIEDFRATMSPKQLRVIYDSCHIRMSNDSSLALYHAINGSKFSPKMNTQEAKEWYEQYDKYVEIRDSLCPTWIEGDTVFAPKRY